MYIFYINVNIIITLTADKWNLLGCLKYLVDIYFMQILPYNNFLFTHSYVNSGVRDLSLKSFRINNIVYDIVVL